jgi:outer membrane lipoprotein LolB
VRSAIRVLGAAALLALAACAGLTPRAGRGPVEFELSGRIAVRYGNDASSGNIAWRHASADDEMLITSPLGQGVARIVRSDGFVTLTASDGREYRARDAETLTEEVLGYRLPLAGLADWVRGRRAPGPAEETRDAEGRLSVLQQGGWRVEYLAYAGGGALPSRLRLDYPGLELRLAIGEWRQPPARTP